MDKYQFNPKLCIHYVRCNVTKDCTKELCMKCRFMKGYNEALKEINKELKEYYDDKTFL